MNKTGGVIGIIAGVFAVIAALVTLVFGGVASAVQAEKASTVVGLGWGGVIFSFLVIVFSAVSFSKAKPAGWGLILSAVLGAIFGGTFVALFMVLAFIGGILVLVGAKSTPSVHMTATAPTGSPLGGSKGWKIAIIAVAVICGGGLLSMLGAKDKKPLELATETSLTTDTVPVAVVAIASPEVLSKLAKADVTGPEAYKLTELGAAPPENQVAAFMRLSGSERPTETQQAARAKAVLDSVSRANDTVVVWDLVVDNVKPAGPGAFNISTKCADLAKRVTPEAQIQMAHPDTNVLLTVRNADESRAVEVLSGCSVIKVKGVVAGFDSATKKVQLSPAIIVKAGDYEARDVKTDGKSEVSAVIPEAHVATEEAPNSEADEKEASLAARSVQPGDEGTELDDKRLHVVDAELNRIYVALMKSLPVDKRAELKHAEIAWIRNKEATCKKDAKCAIQLTEQRLAELSKF